VKRLLTAALAGTATVVAGRGGYRLLAGGELTLDLGVGRRQRPLGPIVQEIAAPPEIVFDVIAAPYLGRTPRALGDKLEVWERGSDMALAAHFTEVKCGTTTTLETIRFRRPDRIDFRLVRGPVPHLSEAFLLRPNDGGTVFTWQGELGTDGWGIGAWWGDRVARAWTHAVQASLPAIQAEAERRATSRRHRPENLNISPATRMEGGDQAFPAVDWSAVPWLSVEQMREVDRMMVEEVGISLVRMMENAGRSLAQVARTLLDGDAAGRSIVVLAGPGGNGGGGLVAARHLNLAGAKVTVALSTAPDRFAPVPAEQLAIVRRLTIPTHESTESLGEPELVLDALLGYSQRDAPRGRAAELIRWSAGRRVLALDVPSGLELATGTLLTPHVSAEATMTLAAPKTALKGSDSAQAVGRLLLADISVPSLVYEQLGLAYETPFTRQPIVELRTERAARYAMTDRRGQTSGVRG
jgi:hydroxyethylthiazole kinase-like uncharacterized protein yjeF